MKKNYTLNATAHRAVIVFHLPRDPETQATSDMLNDDTRTQLQYTNMLLGENKISSADDAMHCILTGGDANSCDCARCDSDSSRVITDPLTPDLAGTCYMFRSHSFLHKASLKNITTVQ